MKPEKMSETKSDNADWKLVYAGRFANLVCFTNSLVVFYVCYLILTYAWNIYVGILIVSCHDFSPFVRFYSLKSNYRNPADTIPSQLFLIIP